MALPLLMLVFLGSCAVQTSKVSEVRIDDHVFRSQNELGLWRVNARAAIRHGSKGYSFQVNWQQVEGAYDVRLYSLLGQGGLRAVGDRARVTLFFDDGRVIAPRNVEKEGVLAMGWPLPIAQLRFWLLGVPAPGDYRFELDSNGRLKSLTQDDWQLTYPQYVLRNGLDLPKRILMERPGLRIRIAIDQWLLGHEPNH